MKSIEAVYCFGNLYDKKTKKRILIKGDAELVIVLNEADQLAKDEKLDSSGKSKPKSSKDKYQELIEKYQDHTPFWKIMKAGDSLYYQINAFRKGEKSAKDRELRFRLTLLEDLYIYNIDKNQTPEKAMLCDCECVIDKCMSDNFEFFEPVYGASLNKARTKNHQLYFSLVANPAANVFTALFYDEAMNKKHSLNTLRTKVQTSSALNKQK